MSAAAPPAVLRARTAPQLLAALAASDGTRPRLTWYDDHDGPTRGERIELSARVLTNWVAKAANLLDDELGVQREGAVTLDLPPHWRTIYWAFAAWEVGAVVRMGRALDVADPPGALVTDRAEDPVANGVRAVGVSLPALARSWGAGALGTVLLATGVLDEAAELAGQPDVFVAPDEPEPNDAALLLHDQVLTAAELLGRARERAAERGWMTGERVALTPTHATADAELLLDLVAAWSVDGSVVLVRDAEAAQLSARWAAERVTSA